MPNCCCVDHIHALNPEKFEANIENVIPNKRIHIQRSHNLQDHWSLHSKVDYVYNSIPFIFSN